MSELSANTHLIGDFRILELKMLRQKAERNAIRQRLKEKREENVTVTSVFWEQVEVFDPAIHKNPVFVTKELIFKGQQEFTDKYG